MKALLWPCLAAGAFAACSNDPETAPPPECPIRCSDDLQQIVDCKDNVVEECGATATCDVSKNSCMSVCAAAEANHSPIGCDYYAVHMDTYRPYHCFAVFIANTWSTPAKLTVEYPGVTLSAADFTMLPSGSGQSLSYAPYNAATGLQPGQVAVMFLSGGTAPAPAPPCPAPAAVPNANKIGTAVASAFHITSDVPVVAYQISPYGAGTAGVTAATLLLPSSAWGMSYVAVNSAPATQGSGNPSLNIIAREDDTVATIMPVAPVVGGGGVPAAAAGQPLALSLKRGQHAQITQINELTGSVVTANKPIGFMAGQTCMFMPVTGTTYGYCDHAEQMLPPTRALGNRYVGVMYRPRVITEAATFWRLVGVVDGTKLAWSSDVGGPMTLNKGQSVMFETGIPFVVTSQDKEHPFMLFTYMTGSQYVSDGYGDPDFVLGVPPEQYLKEYVFFADPTYPETDLVIVRARGEDQQFHDVMLDCLGAVTGWRPVGTDFEFARVDLTTGNFEPIGNCSTGRHEIRSEAPFGLWVWGWGTPNTTIDTKNVSYGYPAGMNLARINDVVIN